MSVDGHAPRAVPAGRVITHEPALVVTIGEIADRVLDLGDKGKGSEEGATGRGRADDSLGGNTVEGGGETQEGEGVLAGETFECEARTVLVTNFVGKLGFQGCNVLDGVCARGTRCAEAVLASIKAEAFGELACVCAVDGGAETFDGRKDLLGKVPIYVWLEFSGRLLNVQGGIGAFGNGRRGGARGRSGGDVGNDIVDADRFSAGDGAKGNLYLRHAVGRRV